MLFIAATDLKKDPVYNNLSTGFKIIEGNYQVGEENMILWYSVTVSVIVVALLSCKTYSTSR